MYLKYLYFLKTIFIFFKNNIVVFVLNFIFFLEFDPGSD